MSRTRVDDRRAAVEPVIEISPKIRLDRSRPAVRLAKDQIENLSDTFVVHR